MSLGLPIDNWRFQSNNTQAKNLTAQNYVPANISLIPAAGRPRTAGSTSY
jgi:hypothetical protein